MLRRLALTLPLLAAACRSPDPGIEAVELMKLPPPIAGADPAVRHAEPAELPARLAVRWQGDGVAYAVDERGTEPATLDVGYRMLLGASIFWTARCGDEEPQWLGGTEVGPSPSPLDLGCEGWTVFGGHWNDASRRCVIEAEIEVFETDVPAFPNWGPDGGHYRVIWRKTLRAEVPARAPPTANAPD